MGDQLELDLGGGDGFVGVGVQRLGFQGFRVGVAIWGVEFYCSACFLDMMA